MSLLYDSAPFCSQVSTRYQYGDCFTCEREFLDFTTVHVHFRDLLLGRKRKLRVPVFLLFIRNNSSQFLMTLNHFLLLAVCETIGVYENRSENIRWLHRKVQ